MQAQRGMEVKLRTALWEGSRSLTTSQDSGAAASG